MNLSFSKKERAFRDEARKWLEANVPKTPLLSGDSREGFAQHVEWEKQLFEAGWSVVSWPEQYGGRGASLVEWLIFEEEYWRAGAPNRVTQNGIFLLAPTIFEFGTDAQKERLLKDIASASHLWAQGWSEPNAGSDLASVKGYAEKTDGGWKLYGQKTWCTRGAFCDSIFGLFRTDPEATRHKGLTYFMVPLNADGITARGVGRLDGDEGFAEVFLDGVFVADEDILGPVNEGWKVAMATTSSERGLSLRSPGRFLATAAQLIELYREYRETGRAEVRDRVVRAWMDAEAYRWFTFKTVTRMMSGEAIGAESSLTKVFWSEMDVAMHETALTLLGPKAELVSGAPDAENSGGWMKGFQFALAGPIYAGTNEIQRNIIAERVLGLPRK
jgi:alkylation response protein AidB-like acyl-CoA dehydrogenase